MFLHIIQDGRLEKLGDFENKMLVFYKKGRCFQA
jgi:hypothetical protein